MIQTQLQPAAAHDTDPHTTSPPSLSLPRPTQQPHRTPRIYHPGHIAPRAHPYGKHTDLPFAADLRSLARVARWFASSARAAAAWKPTKLGILSTTPTSPRESTPPPKLSIDLAASAAALSYTLNTVSQTHYRAPKWNPAFLDAAIALAFSQRCPALLAALASRPTDPWQRYTLSALAAVLATPSHAGGSRTPSPGPIDIDFAAHPGLLTQKFATLDPWAEAVLAAHALGALFALPDYFRRRDAALKVIYGAEATPHRALASCEVQARCYARCGGGVGAVRAAAGCMRVGGDLDDFVRAAWTAANGALGGVCAECARGVKAGMVGMWATGRMPREWSGHHHCHRA